MIESSIDHLPPAVRDALRAEIDAGETLRWCAQPSSRCAFRRAIPLTVAAALGFGAGGVGCLFAARSTWREFQGIDPPTSPHPPGMAAVWMLSIFGGVFLIAALGSVFAPWFAARSARRTVYALTSTRVLSMEVVSPGCHTVRAVEPGHPLHLTRKDRGGGLGDILLYPRDRQGAAAISLLGIPDARAADRLIRATFDPPK